MTPEGMSQEDSRIVEMATAGLTPEQHVKSLQIHCAALAQTEVALERLERERQSLARSASMRRYALHLLGLHGEVVAELVELIAVEQVDPPRDRPRDEFWP